MALGFKVELFHLLAVVDGLGVDLGVTEKDTLPDGLVRFLECDIEILIILNGPHGFFHLHLLTQLSLQQRLSLPFDLHFEVLWFDLDNQLLCSCALGQLNLHIDVLNALRPVVLVGGRTVIGTDALINLKLLSVLGLLAGC